MRFFLKLSYRGASFCGWQRQPNAPSVQQTLEEGLHTILRSQIPIVGAGRTDTGVNARCMYAHFDIPPGVHVPDDAKGFEDWKRRLLTGLDRLCGRDIAMHGLIPVGDDAHARFDAVRRTYKYFVTPAKSAFLHPLSWYCPSCLDMDGMNQAASLLMSTSDFTSFAKLHSDARTNICHVYEARWESRVSEITGEEMLVFTISADRFLRNMVRAIVGTLVEVGRGKMTVDGFKRVIEARDRCAAGSSMPPQALTLWDVGYPYLPAYDNLHLKNM